MTEQQLAAVKQALESLELHGNQYPHMVKGYCLDAITALQSIISQDALNKMAENARELGLDYEPAPVQEGRDWSLLEATQESLREHMAEIKRLKAAQPAPVQEPWVGLTDEEIKRGWKESWVDKQAFEAAVWWAEKKLKEKNT
jgi:hypothetical protein